MAGDCADRPAAYRALSRSELGRGYRAYVRHEGRLSTPAGDMPFRRDVLEVGAVAAVVPYDPARDLLVLQRQFRLTPHLLGLPGHNVEIAAGLIDPGETPEDAARRETREELGLEVTALVPGPRFLPSSGWLLEEAWLFAGRVDSRTLPARAGMAGESEYTEPFTVRPEDAMAAIEAGEMHNGFTLLGLMWFARNHKRLRALWS